MSGVRAAVLCVVFAGALSVLCSTASAVAAQPEWGVCVAAKKAVYANASCTEVAEKKGVADHKGHFEWHAADECYEVRRDGSFNNDNCITIEQHGLPRDKGKFELAPSPTFALRSLDEPTSEILGVGEETCQAMSGDGEVISATEALVQLKFTGCQTLGESSHSILPGIPGEPGEIITEVLKARLTEAEVPAGSGERVPTTQLESESGPSDSIVWWEAGGRRYELTGAVAGVDSPSDAMGTTATTEFAVDNGGEQALQTTVFAPESLGPFATNWLSDWAVTYAQEIELRG